MSRGLVGAALFLVLLGACGAPETEAERTQRLLIAQENAAQEGILREEVQGLTSQVGSYWVLALVGAGLAFWGSRRLSAKNDEREAKLSPLRKQLAEHSDEIRAHERAIEEARSQTSADLAEVARLEEEAKLLFAALRRRELDNAQ